MARHPLYLIVTATLLTSMTACADESAPNRRGIERPLLFGGAQAQQNAEKRETETPSNKKTAPSESKEFPGQSRLESAHDRVLMLDDIGAAATTPAATEQATTAASAATLPQPQVKEKWRDESKPYAVPGKPMVVPDTGGEVIPASWGEPTVLDNYPHRAYADTKVSYMSGKALHNPIYNHTLYAPDQIVPEHGFDGGSKFAQASSPAGANGVLSGPSAKGGGSAGGSAGTNSNSGNANGASTAGSGASAGEVGQGGAVGAGGGNGKVGLYDVAEFPWFYAQTIVMPVFMLFDCPWSQKQTVWTGGDPLYAGGLPAAGNIVPAPYPGEIHYTYEFSTGHATYESTAAPAK